MSDNKNWAQRVSAETAPTPDQTAPAPALTPTEATLNHGQTAPASALTPTEAADSTPAEAAAPNQDTTAQAALSQAPPADDKSATTPRRPDNTLFKCALVTDSKANTVIAATHGFGFPKVKIGVRLYANHTGTNSSSPWMGFIISFPLGDRQAANEASGFGVRSNSMSSHSIFFLPIIDMLTSFG